MASLTNAGRAFRWLHAATGVWAEIPADGIAGLESDLRGLTWTNRRLSRTLIYNLRVPAVRNNVDLCLLDCSTEDYQAGAFRDSAHYVALGELKGGIDPGGADEHWKTAHTALARIRHSFVKENRSPAIFFVGGAIADKMATEIWEELQSGTLANAANLTSDDQVASLCSWLCDL